MDESMYGSYVGERVPAPAKKTAKQLFEDQLTVVYTELEWAQQLAVESGNKNAGLTLAAMMTINGTLVDD